MQLHNKAVAGKFKVVKKIGEEVTYESEWQDNLVTDEGLKMLAKQTMDVMKYLHVTADNTEPTFEDSQMLNHVKVSNATKADANGLDSVVSGNSEYIIIKETRTYKFPLGSNYNISKIHLSPTNLTTDAPFSAALIKDSEGLATSISVIEKEDLYIVYSLIGYVSRGVSTFTFDITNDSGSVTYNGRVTPSDYLSLWKTWLPSNGSPFKSSPVGSVLLIYGIAKSFPINNAKPATGSTIDPGGFAYAYDDQKPYTAKFGSTFSPGITNSWIMPNGIDLMHMWSAGGYYVFEFLDAEGKGIPKSQYHQLTLNFEVTYSRYA